MNEMIKPKIKPNKYRTHTCGELDISFAELDVKLSGWLHAVREHKGVLFFDLRDRYGITQLVLDSRTPEPLRLIAQDIKRESVISVAGTVQKRLEANPLLLTGEIEVIVKELEILSKSQIIPFEVAKDIPVPEDLRLEYRFLDLRRERLQKNMIMRNRVITYIRHHMESEGFIEVHTPVLANSSPEGARDYLVPSRVHPGKFYALPQAPQQFKQLLMVAGFDKYYQIAPCFRDEDARADRSPGEFYQLDFEMSFVEQEDVFNVVERMMIGLTEELTSKKVKFKPFPRLTYKEAIDLYGTDKPDLRFGIKIKDFSDLLGRSGVGLFQGTISSGGAIRGIIVPGAASWSGSKVKKLEELAKNTGAKGIIAIPIASGAKLKGPAGFLTEVEINALKSQAQACENDLILLIADKPKLASVVLGILRVSIAKELNMLNPTELAWGWIVDFPMYEFSETEGKIVFSHNPFSMPAGGLGALNSQDPLEITAFQYDIFCNGMELSSGAVRNHDPEIMYRAFEIAGYTKDQVDKKFGHMIKAFQFGAPPHAGLAPGIERIVMLLLDEPNLREVVAFPKNQRVQDLMLNAPSEVLPEQLDELHLKIVHP